MRRAASLGLAAAGFIAYGTGLHALSCIPYGVTDSFLYLEKSGEPYDVVKGQINADWDAVEDKIWSAGGSEKTGTVEADATIVGKRLTDIGFSDPVQNQLLLRFHCYEGWCPSSALIQNSVLAFVAREGNTWVAELNLCGPNVHLWSQDEEDQILQCHQGQDCLSDEEKMLRQVEIESLH